ncbi:unnamed protein product [Trichobilharzia szidati]|nr:unnamed protein product [Trichobilharzia szidati]
MWKALLRKALSSIKRPFINFDVENRALRHLEKTKDVAKAAPKHPGTAVVVDERYEKLSSHNPKLDADINSFEIKSETITEGILPSGVNYVKNSTRKLPQKVTSFDPYPTPHEEFGFIVPETVPKGKLTMRQAVELMKSYQTGTESADNLSKTYNIDKDKMEHILQHFSLFGVADERIWMPTHLLSLPEQKLLSEPVADTPNDNERIGGSAYNQRKDALEGFKTK